MRLGFAVEFLCAHDFSAGESAFTLRVLRMSALQTPRKKLAVWVVALAWLGIQPVASWIYYETNFRRGAYPPEADTIIIGQMHAVMGWVVTLPIFLSFIWFCFRQYPGRVSLFAFTRERPVWSAVWSAILLALAALQAWSLVNSVVGMFPLDVLSELLAIYLLLCCRSSLMYSRVGVIRHESIEPHA